MTSLDCAYCKGGDMIRILTTGGTIEDVGGVSSSRVRTPIPEMLAQVQCLASIVVEQLFVKNSRDLTLQDRNQILSACKESEERWIVVTHGTHTMCETARYLGWRCRKVVGKTIVLTGALKPGDGLFNLGFALATVQFLPAGIYVVMQGQVFHWNTVHKDEQSFPPRFVVAPSF